MVNEIVNNGVQLAVVKPRSASAEADAAQKAAQGQPTQPEPEKGQPEAANLQDAVDKLNDFVQNIRRTLSFTIEESTGNTVIRVYDSETEELIRQIPPEETLKLAAAIEEQTANLFIKERA